MHRTVPSGLALALGLAAALPAVAAKPVSSAPAEPAKEAPAAPKEAPKDATKEMTGKDGPGGAQAPVAAPAPPEPAERLIEKRDGLYVAKLVVRPGNLKVRRTADIGVDLQKILEIPDPVTGDRQPMSSPASYAIVKAPTPPAPEPVKGKKAPEPVAPAPQKYQLIPTGASGTGTFGFHFTPETDGVYEVTVVGWDPKPNEDSEEGKNFEVTFRIGAGTAAAQTEVSQGAAAARRGARRPVGGESSSPESDKLQKLMEEVGNRYLDFGDVLAKWPAKGPHADAAAEAKAIGALLAQAKGWAPQGTTAASGEFDKVLAATAAEFDELATLASAEGKEKDRGPHLAAATAAWEKIEMQGCNQCHAKFRWGVTTDLSTWPKFEQKPWKK